MEDSLEQYATYRKESIRNLGMKLPGTAPTQSIEMATTNTVYQIQRQLFARSERVKGIDFHPVEPWILTTLYSGMFLGAWSVRCVPCANRLQVMSTYGHTRLKYASTLTFLSSEQALISSRL